MSSSYLGEQHTGQHRTNSWKQWLKMIGWLAGLALSLWCWYAKSAFPSVFPDTWYFLPMQGLFPFWLFFSFVGPSWADEELTEKDRTHARFWWLLSLVFSLMSWGAATAYVNLWFGKLLFVPLIVWCVLAVRHLCRQE